MFWASLDELNIEYEIYNSSLVSCQRCWAHTAYLQPLHDQGLVFVP